MLYSIHYRMINPTTSDRNFTVEGRDLDEVFKKMKERLGTSQWERVEIIDIREGDPYSGRRIR